VEKGKKDWKIKPSKCSLCRERSTMQNPDVDKQYIRRWLEEFDTSSQESNFLKTFEEIVKGL
jgi:hypothetical protein